MEEVIGAVKKVDSAAVSEDTHDSMDTKPHFDIEDLKPIFKYEIPDVMDNDGEYHLDIATKSRSRSIGKMCDIKKEIPYDFHDSPDLKTETDRETDHDGMIVDSEIKKGKKSKEDSKLESPSLFPAESEIECKAMKYEKLNSEIQTANKLDSDLTKILKKENQFHFQDSVKSEFDFIHQTYDYSRSKNMSVSSDDDSFVKVENINWNRDLEKTLKEDILSDTQDSVMKSEFDVVEDKDKDDIIKDNMASIFIETDWEKETHLNRRELRKERSISCRKKQKQVIDVQETTDSQHTASTSTKDLHASGECSLKNTEDVSCNEETFSCEKCGKQCTSQNYHKHKCVNGECFRCCKCGKSFNSQINLTRHKRICVKGEAYNCEKCGKNYKSLSALNHHKRACINGETFKCEKCGITYKYLSALNHHKLVCINGETFNCEKCGNTYKSLQGLNYHKRACINGETFKCEKCGKTYKSLLGFNDHKRFCIHRQILKCEKCGKTYKSHQRMNNHKRVCIHGETWKCEKCRKTYTSSQGLNYHKRLCIHEETFNCEKCGKIYRSSQGWNDHKRCCTDEETFPYENCGKPYKSLKSLDGHKLYVYI